MNRNRYRYRYGYNQRRPRRGFCYPNYRYCGPWCSGPGAPTNEVDYCCMLHDACYDKYGTSMYCDEQFQRCIAPKINRYSKMGRDAALFSRLIHLKTMFY